MELGRICIGVLQDSDFNYLGSNGALRVFALILVKGSSWSGARHCKR
jgi:hypothetical protein